MKRGRERPLPFHDLLTSYRGPSVNRQLNAYNGRRGYPPNSRGSLMSAVTRILSQIEGGDGKAAEQILPLV